jgi:hypothetical protein
MKLEDRDYPNRNLIIFVAGTADRGQNSQKWVQPSICDFVNFEFH